MATTTKADAFTGWPALWPTLPGIETLKDEDTIGGTSAIPVIRVYGHSGVGKTMAGIMTLSRRPDSPHAPTIIWDYELGSEVYTANYKLDHRNMTTFDTKKAAFLAWAKEIGELEAGTYAVAIIDPAEDWEQGLGDYVMDNPSKYGATPNQFRQGGRPSGLYWGAYKKAMKDALTLLASKVQTIYLVNHVRQAYNGNAPIPNKYEPKGSDVMRKLATIEAWLMKNETGYGAPSAVIMKSRLTFPDWDTADEFGATEVKPVLPIYMPEFSANAIRKHLLNPNQPFTAAEMRVVDPSVLAMSDQERMLLQAQIVSEQAAILRAEQEAAEKQLKEALVKELIASGIFHDRQECGQMVAALKEAGVTYESCDSDLSVYAAKLTDAAYAQWPDRQPE